MSFHTSDTVNPAKPSSGQGRDPRPIPIIAMLLLGMFKLWLVSVQELSFGGSAQYDEALFIRIAEALVSGNWLGTYDHITLIKGPFYPFWIAAVHWLGLPLLLSQHLLYITASITLAVALRPILPGSRTLLAVYTLMLLNPMSYSGEIMPRVMREGIYPALGMLCLSGAIGTFLRSRQPLNTWLPWIGISAAGVPAFWLTREEGIWLLPSLVLLTAGTLWQNHKQCRKPPVPSRNDRYGRLILAGIPYLVLLMLLFGIAAMNWKHYGVFTVVEIKSGPFTAAFGALMRSEPSFHQRYIPVPRQTRQALYAVSPAFAELQLHLEGPIGQKWIDGVCLAAHELIRIDHPDMKRYKMFVEPLCQDLGAWFLWALRESAAMEGYHASAVVASQYYQRLGSEINQACSSEQIDCRGPRQTLTPPINPTDYGAILLSMGNMLKSLVTQRGFFVQSLPDSGSPADRERFARITGRSSDRISYNPGDLDGVQNFKITILNWAGFLFNICGAGLTVLASLILIAATARLLISPDLIQIQLTAAALLLAIGTRLVILGIIDTLSFPAASAQYLSPLYPLSLLFGCIGVLPLLHERFFPKDHPNS